jgi:hypothetical protein
MGLDFTIPWVMLGSGRVAVMNVGILVASCEEGLSVTAHISRVVLSEMSIILSTQTTAMVFVF